MPGIEIHENRHTQSRPASISHFVTRVQRPTSRLSPSFRISVHVVVPNPYQMSTFYITAKVKAFFKARFRYEDDPYTVLVDW